MKLWGDMEGRERELAALRLVRGEGLSYSQAAKLLCASKGAIGGALSRAEGREDYNRRMRREAGETLQPVPSLREYRPPGWPKGVRNPTKESWTETRLTEPWALYSARRRAEREASRAEA